jgi:hypothetical protein
MVKYAAYDDDGIWGVGDTEEQAKFEGEGFLKCTCTDAATKEVDEEAFKRMAEELKIAKLSDDLFERIIAENAGTNDLTVHKSDVPFLLHDESGELVFDEDYVPEEEEGEEEDDEDDADGEDDGDEASEDAPDGAQDPQSAHDAGVPSDFSQTPPNLNEQ